MNKSDPIPNNALAPFQHNVNVDTIISGFEKVGGFEELWKQYPDAIPSPVVPNTTCHVINEKWDVMLRDPSDPDMPWPGFLLGQTPASIWYWCADQVSLKLLSFHEKSNKNETVPPENSLSFRVMVRISDGF